MNISELIQHPPNPHQDRGQYYSMGIPEKVMRFISNNVDESSHTLETGCGLSTVLFALSGARHICITPSKEEIERIKDYCLTNDIPIDHLTFHMDMSERVLPGVECEPLDLVLIDGRHGFPAPFIDFYYTADKLKVGGLLVIDDTWLWTGDVLKQNLLLEPEWKLEADFSPRTSVFRKLAEGSQSKEWTQQAFVVNNSQFKLNENRPSYFVTALRYLKKGEFDALMRKIIRKLKAARKPHDESAA